MEDQGSSTWIAIGPALGVVVLVLILLGAGGMLLASVVSIDTVTVSTQQADVITEAEPIVVEPTVATKEVATPVAELTAEATIEVEVTIEATAEESTPEVAQQEATAELTAEPEVTTEVEMTAEPGSDATATPTPVEAENSV